MKCLNEAQEGLDSAKALVMWKNRMLLERPRDGSSSKFPSVFIVSCCHEHPTKEQSEDSEEKPEETCYVLKCFSKRDIQIVYSQAYLQTRFSPCVAPKLLILDLNGVLVYRRGARHGFHRRPDLIPFLSQVFDQFVVGMWSCAKEQNVSRVLKSIMPGEVRRQFCFVIAAETHPGLDRLPSSETCDTEGQYSGPAYKGNPEGVDLASLPRRKNLAEIWQRPERFGAWGPHNTVIVDDSVAKIKDQKRNALVVKSFVPVKFREAQPRNMKCNDEEAQPTEPEVEIKDDVLLRLAKFLVQEVCPAENVQNVLKNWNAGNITPH